VAVKKITKLMLSSTQTEGQIEDVE